jgi:hypothetical protein
MDQAASIQGPPFYFDDVTARVFPLRAHVSALQRLCDIYLNFPPPDDKIRFRPSAPYVLLTLLNYGRMSYSTAAMAHYGWVSQNEVYFGVPLEYCILEDDGRWTRGAGVVAPFIFVDQPWSIEVGREVYGWPKEPAEFQREVNTWASRSPAEREHLLTIATQTFQTPYASEQPSSVPLVEIDRAAPLSISNQLWQAPLMLANPWWGALTLWRESMRIWSSAAAGDTAMYLALIRQASRLLFGGPSPDFSTINLKQARSLVDPARTAYQAITMAPMRLTSLTRAGLMGEGRIALGDPTGGYRVQVHRHPLFPIVETLGLITSDEEQHSDARDAVIRGYTAGVAGNTRLERFPGGLTSGDPTEHGVVTLAPLFPFWLEAGLEYGSATTVSTVGADALKGHRAPDLIKGVFDPTWGARTLPAPPYYYPHLTVRVLALRATRDLARGLESWGPPSEVGSFRLIDPDQPLVLMVVTTSEEMGAQVNSAGWWWNRQVSFCVPVLWARNGRGKDTMTLISVTTFGDSQLSTTIANEIGPNVICAELYAPPDSWLDHEGPSADRRLLWLTTNVLPAIDVGAEATQRVLLEVLALHGGGAAPPRVPSKLQPGDLAFNFIARRQIRDTNLRDAAYDEWFSQDMIARNTSPEAWQVSDAALEVRIHQYPDRLDLVNHLQLQVDRTEYAKSELPGRGWEGAMVNVIKPLWFAWTTANVTHQSNTILAVNRSGVWIPPLEARGFEPAPDDAAVRMLAAFGFRADPLRHG